MTSLNQKIEQLEIEILVTRYAIKVMQTEKHKLQRKLILLQAQQRRDADASTPIYISDDETTPENDTNTEE